MKMEKERLWNANYNKVMFSNFALNFSFYVLTPLLPIYLSEHFAATKDVIGLVLSGYTITALLFRPFSGYIVDTFSRKAVLLFCLLLNVVFFLGYLAASTLLLFTIVRTMHGAPFGGATVANSTIAIDVLPSSRRNEGIGFYGISNNIATAIAPTIGISVYKMTGNFEMLFWMAFVVAFLGMAVVATTQTPQREPESGKRPLSLDRFFLLRGWTLALAIACFGLCYGILSNYLAIYGKERLGITSGTGTYFMLLSLGLILSRLQGATALRKGRLIRNASEGVLISTVGYTLFTISDSMWGYYGSALLIGLGNGHMWPAIQNMIIGMAHHNERGTANSTLLTAWDLGVGLGILLGGVLAELFDYGAAFWSMVIVHIAGVAVYFLLVRQSYIKHRIHLP
ncbi:MAG: MFS transporter [Prevotella sp.]|nr:MFS transporter [Prevotella sp.]MBR3444920.1 MFS transporter [Prevotella sp.]